MKKLLVSMLMLSILALVGCSNNVYDFSKEGEEIRLRNTMTSFENTEWHACDVYYYEAVIGLLYRQKVEDTGYINYDTETRSYNFINELGSDNVISLGRTSIIKVILKK